MHPLKQTLKERGLKFRWVAQQVGVSEQHLNNCLNGNYSYGFPASLLKEICQLLNVDPEPYLKRTS